MPLKASPPATVDLKKSMGRWTVYIHWYSHPLPSTHAHDRARTPSTFCLTTWPIINHRIPILDRFSSSLPILPSVCLSIALPKVSVFNLPFADIRDARDAHIILEAVRLNILPLITRRLSSTEREQLGSGNVFVWEEAEFKGGLERWTDGRRWKVTLAHGRGSAVRLTFSIYSRSQSRMRGDYLFYEEKLEATQEERDIKAARRCVTPGASLSDPLFLMIHLFRARRALDPLSVPPLTNRRQDRPSKPNGLTKQTFSTQVYLPGAHAPRKWHIVAYFSVRMIYLVIVDVVSAHTAITLFRFLISPG